MPFQQEDPVSDPSSRQNHHARKRKAPSSSSSTSSSFLEARVGETVGRQMSDSHPTSTVTSSPLTSTTIICPYLDTIQRSLLDFDFEPSCSVTLESGPHVYGCLVCGKYFRGRGKTTPAYTHSVDEGHFVYVHLSHGTFHCLPDDYEIHDPSLSDISAALHPTFTPHDVATKLDDDHGDATNTVSANSNPHQSHTGSYLARDLFGRRYLPGFVGLNNLHKTDGINAVIQALAHVRPLRNFFLLQTFHDSLMDGTKTTTSTTPSTIVSNVPPKTKRVSHLVQCFGALIRKMWSDKRFKSHVDPHMLIQAISTSSNKRFRIGNQSEAGEFMAWLLHQLHVGLGGTKKPRSSVIHKIFQGRIQVTTKQYFRRKKKYLNTNYDGDDDRAGSDQEDEQGDKDIGVSNMDEGDEIVTTEEESIVDTHFLQLTLEIPEKPLFRDEDGGLVIPQEPLVSVLKKFDGVTFSDVLNIKPSSSSGSGGPVPHHQQKRYRLLELPNYLILHLSRFRTNRYSREKNPTIVMFPVKNLDLSEYVHHNPDNNKKRKVPTEDEVRSMSIKELRQLLIQYGRDDIAKHALERSELIQATIDFVTKSLPDLLADRYDLVANITHDSPADVGREGQYDPLQEGSYRCHVQHRGTKQWYEIQDLHVQETMPQLIGLSESYILIFERRYQKPM